MEEGEDSREGEGEVEALAQAPEHDEGSRWEGARGHLAEGCFEAACRALAVEAPISSVGAGATVAAHTRHAAPRAAVHFAVLAWWGARREAWDMSQLGGTNTVATHLLLALEVQTSAWVWGRATKGQEFVGQLGVGKSCDNPGVTQVFPKVASKLATTAGPAARATGLDGMPALAERASLDPGWHGNGTGGDWPQLGCTVLRMERQGQDQGSPGNAESASLGTATTQAWDRHCSPGSGVWGQPSTTELPCQ